MKEFTYVTLRQKPELKEAYLECMEAYLNHETEYGWEFLCMVQGDNDPDMTRMYIHR